MVKTKQKRSAKALKAGVATPKQELDSVYVLKIILFLVLGAQWIRLVDPALTKQIPVPVGLIVGLYFARHEHFQIDRKVEYAVLIMAALVGFWSQAGVIISILK